MIQLIQPFPSPLDKLHSWQIGDFVSAVDGHPIEDMLDLYYYMPSGDEMVLTIQRLDGSTTEVSLAPQALDQVTSCFAAMEFKTCACECVFCFIDQNPQGMRPSVYVKDEDYRFSFLYGNYITLTSLGKRGIDRVIKQNMTPLFVSVHATDIDVRTKMLGIKKRIDVIEILKKLTRSGIKIHTQIVLCPGWNDGDILDKSIQELYELYPEVETLAIVPVGLSSHRQGLTKLSSVTKQDAIDAISIVSKWQKKSRAKHNNSFVYLSDEIYLLADCQFPAMEHYDDFAQLDNGIGTTSSLADIWKDELQILKEQNNLPVKPITILTGHLAKHAFETRMPHIFNNSLLPDVEIIGVDNTFYGSSVTISGLLTGQDIRNSLASLKGDRQIFLPPRMFNSDNLTLDSMTLEDISQGFTHNILVPDEEGLIDYWANLS
jgi:putative radical SAM enzyme (TIGR03279 family)